MLSFFSSSATRIIAPEFALRLIIAALLALTVSGCEPWIKPYWEPAGTQNVRKPDLNADPDGNYYVVLRKTRQLSKAEDYVAELRDAGFPATYRRHPDNAYLVTVGPYRTSEESEKVRSYALAQNLTVPRAYIADRDAIDDPLVSSGTSAQLAGVSASSQSGSRGNASTASRSGRSVSSNNSNTSSRNSGSGRQASSQSVSGSTANSNYFVVASSGSDEQLAIEKARELKRLGYKTGVYWTQDEYYVVTICFCSLNEAQRTKDRAISRGHASRNAWVTQGQEFIENVYPNGME